jgi:hypothetical protein
MYFSTGVRKSPVMMKELRKGVLLSTILYGIVSSHGQEVPRFQTLQGLYLSEAAFELSYFLDENRYDFLEDVQRALKSYDDYLWSFRDSDGDGCLESMDIMGYSYSCPNILSEIANFQGDMGMMRCWREETVEVRQRMKEYLWDDTRHAYFYRDPDNEVIPTLTHNNLRAMYYGTMTRDTVHFNGLPLEEEYEYTQCIGDSKYSMRQEENILVGKVNDQEVFRCTAGVKVKTDLQGRVNKLSGIDSKTRNVSLDFDDRSYFFTVFPNASYTFGDEAEMVRQVAFDYP